MLMHILCLTLFNEQLCCHEGAEPTPFCTREDIVSALLADHAVLEDDDSLGPRDAAEAVRSEDDSDVLVVDDPVNRSIHCLLGRAV